MLLWNIIMYTNRIHKYDATPTHTDTTRSSIVCEYTPDGGHPWACGAHPQTHQGSCVPQCVLTTRCGRGYLACRSHTHTHTHTHQVLTTQIHQHKHGQITKVQFKVLKRYTKILHSETCKKNCLQKYSYKFIVVCL